MPKEPATKHYTPKGLKIRIPTRGEFDANLDKLLTAPSPPSRYRKGKLSADGAADEPKQSVRLSGFP
jgi:hypothetical protein